MKLRYLLAGTIGDVSPDTRTIDVPERLDGFSATYLRDAEDGLVRVYYSTGGEVERRDIVPTSPLSDRAASSRCLVESIGETPVRPTWYLVEVL